MRPLRRSPRGREWRRDRAPRRPGRRYRLSARMTRLSARPATQTNGIATARNDTMFGSNVKVVALADVGAERHGIATAAASAVAGLVGSSAEAGPGECDGDRFGRRRRPAARRRRCGRRRSRTACRARVRCWACLHATRRSAASPGGFAGSVSPGAAVEDARAAFRHRARRRAASRASPLRARSGPIAPSSAPSTRRHSASSSHSVGPASPDGRSFSALHADEPHRQAAVDRAEQLERGVPDPLADRRRLGQCLRAGDRREVGEAHLDGDRPRLPPVRAQARTDSVGKSAELGPQRRPDRRCRGGTSPRDRRSSPLARCRPAARRGPGRDARCGRPSLPRARARARAAGSRARRRRCGCRATPAPPRPSGRCPTAPAPVSAPGTPRCRPRRRSEARRAC